MANIERRIQKLEAAMIPKPLRRVFSIRSDLGDPRTPEQLVAEQCDGAVATDNDWILHRVMVPARPLRNPKTLEAIDGEF